MTGEAVIMDNQYGTDRGLHKICYIWTVEKTIKAEASEDSKEAVLESIATAYKEVTEARRTGRKLPSLNSLIEELKAQ